MKNLASFFIIICFYNSSIAANAPSVALKLKSPIVKSTDCFHTNEIQQSVSEDNPLIFTAIRWLGKQVLGSAIQWVVGKGLDHISSRVIQRLSPSVSEHIEHNWARSEDTQTISNEQQVHLKKCDVCSGAGQAIINYHNHNYEIADRQIDELNLRMSQLENSDKEQNGKLAEHDIRLNHHTQELMVMRADMQAHQVEYEGLKKQVDEQAGTSREIADKLDREIQKNNAMKAGDAHIHFIGAGSGTASANVVDLAHDAYEVVVTHYGVRSNKITFYFTVEASDPKDLFLAELKFYTYDNGFIDISEDCLSGFINERAFPSGADYDVTWDIACDGLSDLEGGEAIIKLTQISKEDSRRIYNMYQKQVKLLSKIERRTLKGKSTKQARIRLGRLNARIGN